MTTDTIAHKFASMIIVTNDDAELRDAGLDTFSPLLTHTLNLDELKVKLFRFSDDSIMIEGPEDFALSTVKGDVELAAWFVNTFPGDLGEVLTSLKTATIQAAK